MTRAARSAWMVAAAAVVYATLRYNAFGTVLWSDWPVYVLNKALALTGLLACVCWAAGARRAAADQSALLALGSRAAFAHVVFSLALLGPTYFPAFFSGDRLSWHGSLSLGIGVVTMLVLQARAGRGPSGVNVRWIGVAAFLAGLHAASYGYPGWLTPSAWPGGLPPITMVSFTAGVIALSVAVRPD